MSLHLEDRAGHVALILDRPPANAIDVEMVQAISAALDEVAARPLLITSANSRIFSGGLDLKALDALPVADFRSFAGDLQVLCRRIFTHPAPVVALLTGHAIAGGYLLAAMADVVVLASVDERPARIGLPEVTLGVPVPGACLELLRHRLTATVLAEVVLEGRSFPAAVALEKGMVDGVRPPAEAAELAVDILDRFAEGGPPAFAALKTQLRRPFVEAAAVISESALDTFVTCWQSDDARSRRLALLESLKKR